MTIFHVLKYPITSVEHQSELDLLPAEVITKWRRRMEDHAIDAAKSVIQLGNTNETQKVIDAIYLYRDGKIRRERMCTAFNALTNNNVAHASISNAMYAVDSTYASNNVSCSAYACYAAHAARAVTCTTHTTGSWDKFREESYSLFKKWLTEELYNYDMDVA